MKELEFHIFLDGFVYRISSKERPGRSFKSRHSRGGAHSSGDAHSRGRLFKNQRFTMEYKVEFNAAFREHHIYKANWKTRPNEMLSIKKDNRQEALSYDIHALGVHKAEGTLAGHLPIELPRVLDYFLQQNEDNFIDVQVTGKRKREVGLVVPVRYTAHTRDRETAVILEAELKKRKELFSRFAFTVENIPIARFPAALSKYGS